MGVSGYSVKMSSYMSVKVYGDPCSVWKCQATGYRLQATGYRLQCGGLHIAVYIFVILVAFSRYHPIRHLVH